MTYNQLKEDVAALGFEAAIENESQLLIAANRALRIIYTERPRECQIRLSCQELGEHLIHRQMHHMGKEKISVSLTGEAYSFRVSGRGEYTVTDTTGSRSFEFDGESSLMKGYIKGEATLVFEGDYSYTVYDLCCYDRRFGDGMDSIPERQEYRTFKLGDTVKGFRAFASLPTDNDGKRIEGSILRGESLLVPRDFCGEINLSYYRTPDPITEEDADLPIDISEETVTLLPLLTASFLWLDDDEGKAQYYMALYREALSGILRYSKSQIDTQYTTNGWA